MIRGVFFIGVLVTLTNTAYGEEAHPEFDVHPQAVLSIDSLRGRCIEHVSCTVNKDARSLFKAFLIDATPVQGPLKQINYTCDNYKRAADCVQRNSKEECEPYKQKLKKLSKLMCEDIKGITDLGTCIKKNSDPKCLVNYNRLEVFENIDPPLITNHEKIYFCCTSKKTNMCLKKTALKECGLKAIKQTRKILDTLIFTIFEIDCANFPCRGSALQYSWCFIAAMLVAVLLLTTYQEKLY